MSHNEKVKIKDLNKLERGRKMKGVAVNLTNKEIPLRDQIVSAFESAGASEVKLDETGFCIHECGVWLKRYICDGGNLGKFLVSKGLPDEAARNCWFGFTNL